MLLKLWINYNILNFITNNDKNNISNDPVTCNSELDMKDYKWKKQ